MELKDILAQADAALYRAKQSGRNKAVCSTAQVLNEQASNEHAGTPRFS